MDKTLAAVILVISVLIGLPAAAADINGELKRRTWAAFRRQSCFASTNSPRQRTRKQASAWASIQSPRVIVFFWKAELKSSRKSSQTDTSASELSAKTTAYG